MKTDEEELRKEYFKMLGMAAPIAERENPELFDWFYSKLEAKDKEIAELKIDRTNALALCELMKKESIRKGFMVLERNSQITDLKAEIERLKTFRNDVKTLIDHEFAQSCTHIRIKDIVELLEQSEYVINSEDKEEEIKTERNVKVVVSFIQHCKDEGIDIPNSAFESYFGA